MGLGNFFSKPRNLAFLCLLLAFALLLAYLPRNAVDIAPRIDPNKQELVFVTHNGPTTYYLGNDNLPAGIEYDLALMFVRDYYPDHEIRFVLANSISEVIPSLLKNKAHIAAANLSITPLRKHQVQFSIPYQETQQQLIFNNELNKKPQNLDALLGKKISVPKGTSYAERLMQLKKSHPGLKWAEVNQTNTESLLEEVGDGLLDYTVADSHLAALMQNHYPNLDVAMNIGPSDHIAWAMSKNADPRLVRNVQAFFAKIKADGSLRNLLDRYYGHNVGEKGQYRTQEEIAEWRTSKDPIDYFTGVVLERKFATQQEIDDMRASVRIEIDEAVAFAESSPEPDISTITQGVDSGKLGIQL